MLIILAIIVLPVSETVFLWMYGFEILIVIFFFDFTKIYEVYTLGVIIWNWLFGKIFND